MDAHQHLLGNLLQCDPTDPNAVSLKMAAWLNNNLTFSDKVSFINDIDGIALKDDFTGASTALADNPMTLVTQNGTASTAAAIDATAGAPVAGLGGWIAGSVDNVDDVSDEIALGHKPWARPASLDTGGLMTMEVGFVIPAALTAQLHFIGWTDAVTYGGNDNGGALGVDGTTNVVGAAGDAAGFLYSSLATDADGYYTGNIIATTAVADATNSGLTAVVDDYTKLRVEIDAAGNAYYWGAIHATLGRDSTTPVLLGTKALAVTTTDLFVPMFQSTATATTAVPWEVDYILASASLA